MTSILNLAATWTDSITENNKKRHWVKKLKWFLGIFMFLVVLAVLIPSGHGPHNRQIRNEVATVGNLRYIHALQEDRARDTGEYACELGDLAQIGPSTDEYGSFGDLNEMLNTGLRSGYRLAISECRSTDRERHYMVTAVPNEPRKSGFRAFCMNESGMIFENDEGSVERCVAEKKVLD